MSKPQNIMTPLAVAGIIIDPLTPASRELTPDFQSVLALSCGLAGREIRPVHADRAGNLNVRPMDLAECGNTNGTVIFASDPVVIDPAEGLWDYWEVYCQALLGYMEYSVNGTDWLGNLAPTSISVIVDGTSGYSTFHIHARAAQLRLRVPGAWLGTLYWGAWRYPTR